MKSWAALRGVTLKEFLLNAVPKEILNNVPEDDYRAEPPMIRSKHPGALSWTNAEIEDLLT